MGKFNNVKKKFINPSKMPKFTNLILLLLGSLFGLLIAEGMLRIAGWPQLSVDYMPCIYLPDEQFGYRYKPNVTGWIYRNSEIDNVFKINSIGFHDIEHKNNNGDVLRILALGNSFTAALEVETTKGWTQTLQRELHNMGHLSIDVVNLGLDGTGTDVHLAILKQYLPIFQPSLVILAFFVNDIQDIKVNRRFRECYEGYVLVFENEEQRGKLRDFVDKHKPNFFSTWLFNNLYLFRVTTFFYTEGILLRSNFLSLSRVGLDVGQEAVNPRNLDSLLQQFVTLSQQHNFKLLVIPVPSRRGLMFSLDILQDNISVTTLAQLNIVDVSPIIQDLLMKDNKPPNEMFWRYDAHFNAYGNRIFGLAVAEAVDEYIRTAGVE